MFILAPIVMLSLVSVGSLAILLAILVPLNGALVRFRTHYNPKGLQLDPEAGVQPRTGPVITSFFAMLVRVYKIEGWPGLYKGLMPNLLAILLIATLYLSFFLSDSSLRHGTYSASSTSVLGTLATLFAMVISLPLMIIANRAITTPHKLPFFNPSYSLRILLTPTERRRPWILYLTPGLLAALGLQIVYVGLGLGTVRHLLLPELTQPGLSSGEDVPLIRLAIFIVLSLASTVVLTPLDVISTRLSIQRNHTTPEINSVPREEGDAEVAVEYTGINEDVISLRTEREPYSGLVDCANKIIEEEGWSALYRAWWLTMLALGFS